jgi:hypothetical protein
MNAIGAITDEEWQKYWLYLYRLDPKVKNEEDKAYISRYQCSMNEDEVRTQHGGGKFMFWLKENVNEENRSKNAGRNRKFKFGIAGEPKLLAGQVLLSPSGEVIQGNTPPAEARRDDPTSNALAPVLSELVALLKQRGGNDDQAMSIMGQAYKTSLTVVSEAAQQTVKSATGSTLGDKLLEAVLPSLLNRPAVEKDPVREALLKSALARLENPPPSAAADGSLGQLSFLKELMGVESLKDLIMPGAGPGDAWKTKLVEAGVGLVANLPMIIQAVMAGQERAFQREMQIAAIRERQAAIAAGYTPPPMPLAPPPPPVPPAGVSPIQPQPIKTAGNEIPINATASLHPDTWGRAAWPQAVAPVAPVAVTDQVLLDIALAFNSGLPGGAAASFILTKYPQFVPTFASLLADKAQVLLFAQNTEPLSQVAGDEEFPEFLEGFCEELLNPQPEEPDSEPVA